MEADPVLIPKPATSREVAAPTASPSVDYSRIFSGKEVNSKARVLEKPEATYTAIARRNQIAGTVVLRAVFSSAGTVTNIRVVSSLPDGLTEQAIEAAKKIRFVPATKDGHPVSMYMELRYNFNLY
jgi:TonB family protein